jgi:sugar O-acyltransferase (sialic acid O-acetyltransferase NeuD family)
MNNIIIYGSGGHAKVVIDLVEKEGRFRINGLIDDHKPKGTRIFGYEVLGGLDCLSDILVSGLPACLVAIGDNRTRRKLTELVGGIGFSIVFAVHPAASLARNVSVEEGTVILAGSVIDPDVRIGKGVIVNNNAVVAHDSRIGDFTHISVGASVGANVTVGDDSFIGMGAIVVSGINIGKGVYIGAGSVVAKDVPDNVKAIGMPARIMRKA